jgi:hypothetical protein|tara:strand:- start:162 stop:545 length:384 start_codon:yes stop_codon:yes gene_type:complete
MYLVLEKENFNKEKIIFKYRSGVIKLNFLIEKSNLLGLLFSIENFKIIHSENDFFFIRLSDNDQSFFSDLDLYLSNKMKNYMNFIINGTIKVKNNNNKNNINSQKMFINISSIKNKDNIFITHIYVV